MTESESGGILGTQDGLSKGATNLKSLRMVISGRGGGGVFANDPRLY